MTNAGEMWVYYNLACNTGIVEMWAVPSRDLHHSSAACHPNLQLGKLSPEKFTFPCPAAIEGHAGSGTWVSSDLTLLYLSPSFGMANYGKPSQLFWVALRWFNALLTTGVLIQALPGSATY